MGKYYSDLERYEHVRKYKLSGKTISEYARENNIIETEDITVNMLSEVEKLKKSSHFSRFDHSVVVIEYKEIKITTSLEQAEKLLEKIL